MNCISIARRVFHSTRNYSTSSSPYPFSTAVHFPTLPSPSPPILPTSLLRTLNHHLASFHPHSTTLLPLFSRRSPDRLLPGSVITVSSYSSPPSPENPSPSITTFSGVLIAIRRRHAGLDSSFRLRSIVGRTGVEISFKLLSPLVKEVKVVQRATTSGAAVYSGTGVEVSRKKPAIRAAKRAKLYYVRDQPDKFRPHSFFSPWS